MPSRMIGTNPHALGIGGDMNRVQHLNAGIVGGAQGQNPGVNFEQLSLI